MYKKFTNQLDDGSEPTHYIYYYKRKKLGHSSTIGEDKHIKNDLAKGQKELNISVQKKLRIIKCPDCICNDCIINLDEYVLSFCGCKHEHNQHRKYDDYIQVQKIESQELRCMHPGCPYTQENYLKGFYKCFDCSKVIKKSVNKRSRYFCKEHISEPEHNGHFTAKYDKKNFYCEKHYKPFSNYCFDHKADLCNACLNDSHKGDKIQNYDLMLPNLDKLNESLNLMEKNINQLDMLIETISARLFEALRVFKRYHYVAKDIVGKYELFNKDLKKYTILKSLRNIKFSNLKMNKELTDILAEEEEIKQISALFRIADTLEEGFIRNTGQKLDSIKDNDNDWYEEIIKTKKSSKK